MVMLICILVPIIFGLKGIGTRKTWFGGGIVVLCLAVLYIGINSASSRTLRPNTPGEITWEPIADGPTSPLAEIAALGFPVGLGFIVAGMCYRREKQRRTFSHHG